jgi:hypothetical protein
MLGREHKLRGEIKEDVKLGDEGFERDSNLGKE